MKSKIQTYADIGLGNTRKKPLPVPMAAIGLLLKQSMDECEKNGSNSISMPDELVDIAHFLAYPHQYTLTDDAADLDSKDAVDISRAITPDKWEDQLRQNHPTSDPDYWPDELKLKYMALELEVHRSALAESPSASVGSTATKYFVTENYSGPSPVERMVSVEEFCRAERNAGFRPKGLRPNDPGYMTTPATAGFSGNNISGRVVYHRHQPAQTSSAPSLGLSGSGELEGRIPVKKALHVATIEAVEALRNLPDEARREVFGRFCVHCGCDNPSCFCMRDD